MTEHGAERDEHVCLGASGSVRLPDARGDLVGVYVDDPPPSLARLVLCSLGTKLAGLAPAEGNLLDAVLPGAAAAAGIPLSRTAGHVWLVAQHTAGGTDDGFAVRLRYAPKPCAAYGGDAHVITVLDGPESTTLTFCNGLVYDEQPLGERVEHPRFSGPRFSGHRG